MCVVYNEHNIHPSIHQLIPPDYLPIVTFSTTESPDEKIELTRIGIPEATSTKMNKICNSVDS